MHFTGSIVCFAYWKDIGRDILSGVGGVMEGTCAIVLFDGGLNAVFTTIRTQGIEFVRHRWSTRLQVVHDRKKSDLQSRHSPFYHILQLTLTVASNIGLGSSHSP